MIKPESSKGVAFAHHSTKNLSLASKTQGAILPVMTNYKGTEASSPHGKLSEIVVAYSGGLDTSVIIRWLRENFGCEVVLFTVNVGQVPFGLTSFALNPDLQVVAPRREDSIEYDTREIFWRTNPVNGPMKDMYMMPVDPKDARDKPEYLDIWIFSGFPVSINGKELSPAYFLSELNDIGNCYRSGQIDLVESRLVGMKSRGVYNTSRGAVLTVASHEPEFLTLDKDNLVHKSLELVYAGRWFDPLWESIDAFMENITKTTTGSVTVKLYNRSVFVASRKSPCSLYVIRPMLLDSYAWMDCLGG